MPPRDPGRSAERRFSLARPPVDGRAELHPDDVDHALRVLRLGVGDAVLGLDGAGRAWRLAVAAIERRRVALAGAELAEEEAEPGTPAAGIPHVTLYVSLPKPGPAEEMLDRLTQLGAARIVPLVAERTPPHARELSPARRERLERIAREALKQSGRLWMPVLGAPVTVADAVRTGWTGTALLLDPDAPRTVFDLVVAGRQRSERAWSVFVGPEGGLTGVEVRLLEGLEGPEGRGALAGRLGPHVLRIETAAEAALAVIAAGALPPGPQSTTRS